MYTHEETSNDWVRKENLSVNNWFDENQIELIESPTNGVIRGLKTRDDWIKIKNQRLLSEVIPTPLRLKKINNYKSDSISRKSIIFEDAKKAIEEIIYFNRFNLLSALTFIVIWTSIYSTCSL